MHRIRYIRRIAAVLAGLVTVLVAFATTPAFATEDPPAGGGGPAVVPRHLAPVHAVAGGMPSWQIILIGAGAALIAATVAVLLDRASWLPAKSAPEPALAITAPDPAAAARSSRAA